MLGIPQGSRRVLNLLPKLQSSCFWLQQHQRGLAVTGRATKRDPPLPPLINPVEQAINAAQRRGELKNLSGSGKPLAKSSNETTLVTGMSSSKMFSKKAEFEMKRAIRNRELEDIAGKGEKLKYKGTTGVSTTIGGSSGDGGSGGGEVMSRYILEESKPSVEDMKNIQK